MFAVLSIVHELLLLGCCCYLFLIPFAVEKSQFCLCCIWDSSPPLLFFQVHRKRNCLSCYPATTPQIYVYFPMLLHPLLASSGCTFFFFFFSILLNMHLSEFNLPLCTWWKTPPHSHCLYMYVLCEEKCRQKNCRVNKHGKNRRENSRKSLRE